MGWEKYHTQGNYRTPDTSIKAYADAANAPEVAWRLRSQDQLRILTLGVASHISTFEHMKMWKNDRLTEGITNDQEHTVVDYGYIPMINSHRMLNMHDNMRMVQASSEALPFPDGYFDVVMTHCLLGCMKWDMVQKTLRESSRVVHGEGVQLHNIRSKSSKLMVALGNIISGQIINRLAFGVPNYRRLEGDYEGAFYDAGQDIIAKKYDYNGTTVTYALAHTTS